MRKHWHWKWYLQSTCTARKWFFFFSFLFHFFQRRKAIEKSDMSLKMRIPIARGCRRLLLILGLTVYFFRLVAHKHNIFNGYMREKKQKIPSGMQLSWFFSGCLLKRIYFSLVFLKMIWICLTKQCCFAWTNEQNNFARIFLGKAKHQDIYQSCMRV